MPPGAAPGERERRSRIASAPPARSLRAQGNGGQVGDAPGDATMIGGPALSAIAALRAGAGLARLLMPQPILAAGLVIAPSATGLALPVDDRGAVVPHLAAEVFERALESCDCLAIGPGLGVSRPAEALALRAVGQSSCPVVVDADALNNLTNVRELHRDFKASAILTPHPGEFARLAKAMGITADAASDASRPGAAEQLAQRLGCIVVLKGARTIVSDGVQTWTNDAADAALATAGTGDVLTGLIAGLVAQFGPNQRSATGVSLFDLARIGVAAHATAAARWRDGHRASAGLLAIELADELPAALESLREAT